MGNPRVRGVLFDMDGTLVDVPYDWPRIRADLGAAEVSILTYLGRLEEPERSQKWAILEAHEEEATRQARLRPGVTRLLKRLGDGGIRTALVTNNSRTNTDILLSRFGLAFNLVLTRDDGLWKPSGAPLVAAMARLGLVPEECLAVGDSSFDVRAAREAGIPGIFVIGPDGAAFTAVDVVVVPSIDELERALAAFC
jgi:HAD superfamily hydrolase (TIGR01509 family)